MVGENKSPAQHIDSRSFLAITIILNVVATVQTQINFPSDRRLIWPEGWQRAGFQLDAVLGRLDNVLTLGTIWHTAVGGRGGRI